MKIWLAVSGDYSDYCVHCAFTTEALAKEFCTRENRAISSSWNEYMVEELNLLNAVPSAFIAHNAFATLNTNGELADIHFNAYRENGSDEYSEPVEVVKETANSNITHLRVNYSRTEDEARKALFDLAARVKAERANIA